MTPVRAPAANPDVVPGLQYNLLNSGYGLSAHDMHTLTSSGMINNEIINFTLGLFQHFALSSYLLGRSSGERWLFMNTFFMDKLYP